MNELMMILNNFALKNLVSLNIEFNWFDIVLKMMRDDNCISIKISNKELQKANVDVVTFNLNKMLDEINKKYD